MRDRTTSKSEFDNLDITCSSSQCPANLHYFGPSGRARSTYPIGRCRDCGTSLVDFGRVQKRCNGDLEYLIASLQTEFWRHHWWFHRMPDAKTINHAQRKGRAQLKRDAAHILRKYVCSPHFRDGAQTKTKDNIIHLAQHATATCCRKCLAYWHGIGLERDVIDEEIEYLVSVIMRFVDFKLPDLTEGGVHVPPMGRKAPGRANVDKEIGMLESTLARK